LVGHYVSVVKTLQHYLSHIDVWASCQKRHAYSEDLLCDYTDGLTWKASGLPANHIRLHLYSDEFEICNPLGSKRGVHKLCAFYYMIGNVSVKYRSLLQNIHLAVLVKYRYVRDFGYNAVLKPLISDLQDLAENGICITVAGESFTVKGSVVTLSGDNLSMHGIGGFCSSFRSGRVCRQCTVSYNNLSVTRSEEDGVVRTSPVHKFQVNNQSTHLFENNSHSGWLQM